MAAKGKKVRRKGQKGQLSRRRENAAYRRANRERVEKIQGAIEAALAEGARLRDEISLKIGRRIAATEARAGKARLRRK